MEHLFQGCEWARSVWEEGIRSCGKYQIGEGTIQDKIKQWEETLFENAIVRRL